MCPTSTISTDPTSAAWATGRPRGPIGFPVGAVAENHGLLPLVPGAGRLSECARLLLSQRIQQVRHGLPGGHVVRSDSQWAQWRKITDFYRWCRARGVYLNVPDFYYLNGSNKCGMGYREATWSDRIPSGRSGGKSRTSTAGAGRGAFI